MSSINYQAKYNEYHNKFWKLHHTSKDLVNEIDELKMKVEIYERRIICGKIKMISQHHDYGLINHSDYGDIFFHKSKCNFHLSNLLVGRSVKFNLTITKKFEAINVVLIIDAGNISSAFDILDYIDHSVDESDGSDESDESSDSIIGLLSDILADTADSAETAETTETTDTMALDIINSACDIWYMNYRCHDELGWLNCIDNGFVTSWSKSGRNDSLKERLKINDIIAWYAIGRGYAAILKVIGKCCKITDEELSILKCGDKEEIKGHRDWEKRENCEVFKIPVQILSYRDMNNCIKGLPGWVKEDWTSGFRGPYAMKPKNNKWKNQVIAMYEEMK